MSKKESELAKGCRGLTTECSQPVKSRRRLINDINGHVMRRVVIIAAFVVATGIVGARFARPLSVYFWPASTASIEDASRAIDIILHAPPDLKSVYALDVVGVGWIDGEAEIALVLNGAPYKSRYLDGAVLFTWGGDWYGPEAVVRYTPALGANGVITLNYRFRSL